MGTERQGSVCLSSYNLGDVDDDEYDRWINFICERIDAKAGFEVLVQAKPFGASGSDTFAGDEETVQILRDAMRVLWDEWCAEGAP